MGGGWGLNGNTEDEAPVLGYETSAPSPVTVPHARWSRSEVPYGAVPAAVQHSRRSGWYPPSDMGSHIRCGRTLNYAEQQKDGGEDEGKPTPASLNPPVFHPAFPGTRKNIQENRAAQESLSTTAQQGEPLSRTPVPSLETSTGSEGTTRSGLTAG